MFKTRSSAFCRASLAVRKKGGAGLWGLRLQSGGTSSDEIHPRSQTTWPGPTHRLFRQCGRPPGVKVKAKRNCPKPAFHSFIHRRVSFRAKDLAGCVCDWQVVTGGLLLLLLCLAEANQNLLVNSTLQRYNNNNINNDLPCETTFIYFSPPSHQCSLSTVRDSSETPELLPSPVRRPLRATANQIANTNILLFVSTASSLKVNKTCGCSFPAVSSHARSLTANCAFFWGRRTWGGWVNLNVKHWSCSTQDIRISLFNARRQLWFPSKELKDRPNKSNLLKLVPD